MPANIGQTCFLQKFFVMPPVKILRPWFATVIGTADIAIIMEDSAPATFVPLIFLSLLQNRFKYIIRDRQHPPAGKRF